MKDALAYTKSELQKFTDAKIRIIKTRPSDHFTGTVLLLQKGSKRLRFIKHDKYSWEIAKYTVNDKHTTATDMMQDIQKF